MPGKFSCADFEDLAVLYATQELGEEEVAWVEAHARDCSRCGATLRNELELREAIAAREQAADKLDRSGLLLAQCRSELAEALDDAQAGEPIGETSDGSGDSRERRTRGWSAWWSPSRWRVRGADAFRRALVFHPGWSTAALLIAGALGGLGGRAWYRETSMPLPGKPVMTVSAAPRLSDGELDAMGVEGIQWNPQDDGAPPQVEVQLRSERPVVVEGPADDTEIRRVLLYVLGHAQRFGSGVRLDSLDVLRTRTADPQVRTALCDAARNDDNTAVRLKALEALHGLGNDPGVRQTMLGALAEDDNSGVRVEAVNALLASLGSETDEAKAPDTARVDTAKTGAEAQNEQSALFAPQALNVLRDRMRNDPNNYVRLRSAAVLGRLASLETPDDTDKAAGSRR